MVHRIRQCGTALLFGAGAVLTLFSSSSMAAEKVVLRGQHCGQDAGGDRHMHGTSAWGRSVLERQLKCFASGDLFLGRFVVLTDKDRRYGSKGALPVMFQAHLLAYALLVITTRRDG